MFNENVVNSVQNYFFVGLLHLQKKGLCSDSGLWEIFRKRKETEESEFMTGKNVS